MEWKIKENVMINLFDHLTMKCTSTTKKNLHYLNLMINDVKNETESKPWNWSYLLSYKSL